MPKRFLLLVLLVLQVGLGELPLERAIPGASERIDVRSLERTPLQRSGVGA